MLRKRGIGGEVDWIIAMGIFLVFIGVVFTLFKPGITPTFDYAALQGIVAENFFNDTGWELHKQPIFLEEVSWMESTGTKHTGDLGLATFAFTGTVYTKEGAVLTRQDNFPLFVNFFGEEATQQSIEERMKVFAVSEGAKGAGVLTTQAIRALDAWELSQLSDGQDDRNGLVAITGREVATETDAQDCTEDSDCRNGEERKRWTCFNSVCKPPQKTKLGDACRGHDDCESDYCDGSRCKLLHPLDEGEYCSENFQCSEGLVCNNRFLCCALDKACEPKPEPGKRPGSPTDSAAAIAEDADIEDTGSDEHQKKGKKHLEAYLAVAQKERREYLGEYDTLFEADVDRSKTLRFRAEVQEKKRYILVYSREKINFDTSTPPGGLYPTPDERVQQACIIPEYDPAAWPESTACRARYSLGVRETARGIDIKKVVLLGTKKKNGDDCADGGEYACVKEKWGYPQVKDFQVQIFSNAIPGLNLVFNNVVIPPEATVRVKQVNSFIVTEEGLKVPVTVSIKVW